jgi:hypothetical protein
MNPQDLDNKGQRARVWDVIKDGKWWMLEEIAYEIRSRFGVWDSEAAISARLRDFRKSAYGGHTIERMAAEDGSRLYLYRVADAPKGQQELGLRPPAPQRMRVS